MIIFYTTALYNNVCTRMRVCSVEVLPSYSYSSATLAKQSLGMFNSVQCIQELLSILIRL